MSYRPQLNYPVHREQLRLDQKYPSITNKGVLPSYSVEKRTIGEISTPTSVKDIDEEIKKLTAQYQMNTGKPLGLLQEIKRNPLPSESIRNIGNQKSPLQEQSQKKFKIQSHKSQPKFAPKLVDYSSSSAVNSSVKVTRESQSTIIEEFYRSQPSFSEMTPSFKISEQQNGLKSKSFISGISDVRSSNHQGNLPTTPLSKNLKDIQLETTHKTFHQTTPFSTNSIQQAEILRTTKPTSQFLRIRQQPPKQSPSPNTQKIYERKPNHQRESRKQRQMSLPFPTDLSNLGSEGSSYIQIINDRNRVIVKLQTTISKFQNTIQQKQQLLQKYKFDLQLLRQSTKRAQFDSFNTISKLKRQVELNNLNRHSTNSDLQNKFQKINFENQQLSTNYNILQKDIAHLKKELEKKKESEEIHQNMYAKLKSIIVEKSSKATELEKCLDIMTQQNNDLRKRISQILTEMKVGSTIIMEEDKNQIITSVLKMNDDENIKYKNNLNAKDQIIHRLEEISRQYKAMNDTLRNDIEIEKLKRMTDLKNLQTSFKIQEQVKMNEISSLNRTLQSMEDKLKYIIQEDRKKDQFMVQYLRGRADAPEEKLKVDDFFKRFQMLSVNTNILECLKREQAEIETLKGQMRKLILRT